MRRISVPSARVLRAGIAAVVLGLFVVIARWETDPVASCMADVKRGMPVMRAIAGDTMPHSAVLESSDGAETCEETYVPRPEVTARMTKWRSQEEAVAYLRARGWHANPSRYLTSPDHEDVSAVIEEGRQHGKPYVEVSFVAFQGLDQS